MADSPDLSNAIEQLQQMLSSDDGQSQIQNIINMFTSENSSDSASTAPEASSDGNIPDMETIMKITGIIRAINQNEGNNPKAAFLTALRPFLKEQRRKKLDSASKIFKIASVLKLFRGNSEGGD